MTPRDVDAVSVGWLFGILLVVGLLTIFADCAK